MDANPLTSLLNASPGPAGPAVQGVSPSVTPGTAPGEALRGADFANLLGSMLADPKRQGIAAAGLAEAGLQALPLGSQIEVITAAKPVPDTGSLMAFARSQGLDESTLASLFGDLAAPAPAGVAGLSATSATVGAAYFLAGQALALNSVKPTTVAALSVSELALQTPDVMLGQTLVSQANAVIAPLASDLVLAADGSFKPTPAPVPAAYFLSAQGLAAHPASVTAVPLATATAAATDVAWQVTKPPVQSALTGMTALGEVKPVSADKAMSDALRVELLLPREAVTALTRRLATLSGNGQAQTWGNLTANAVVAASPGQTTLDMRQFFTPAGTLAEPVDSTESVDGITTAVKDADTGDVAAVPIDGSRKAAGSLTLSPDVVNPSQSAQRAENYQLLADRLGQALGQRLQAQIERGEWKMQMRLDPASLGRIDLELQMRSGGLDAVFRSDNPLTRELITQGLPKLRDSLSQSGTAVANVWVNGDSARQSGGNPTPSQTPRSHAPNDSDAVAGPVQSVAATAPSGSVRQSDSSGAWDVLA